MYYTSPVRGLGVVQEILTRWNLCNSNASSGKEEMPARPQAVRVIKD